MTPVATDLPLLLKPSELRRRLGLGQTKFWQLRKSGALDVCVSPIPGYYSTELVLAWLAKREQGAQGVEPSRSFGASRHASKVAR